MNIARVDDRIKFKKSIDILNGAGNPWTASKVPEMVEFLATAFPHASVAETTKFLKFNEYNSEEAMTKIESFDLSATTVVVSFIHGTANKTRNDYTMDLSLGQLTSKLFTALYNYLQYNDPNPATVDFVAYSYYYVDHATARLLDELGIHRRNSRPHDYMEDIL